MKLANLPLLLTLLLSACALNHSANESLESTDASLMVKYRDQVELSGSTWMQIHQDMKRNLSERQALLTQWQSSPEGLSATDRLRAIALLLINTDSRSHLQALMLLTTMPEAQQKAGLPLVEWLTALAKNQIIEDSQLRDLSQQLADAELKISALESKIKELKALESNLLSRPSENH